MATGHKIIEVDTQPYDDQKPGTSGLRKKVKVFMRSNYTENFVQSILTSLGDSITDSFLVIGSDGRYFGREAIKKIIKICAANKVRKLSIAHNGLMSTPALSGYIRKYGCLGGIILTASHNPGGEDGDFGIKFNSSNGGPAPASVTNKIFEISKDIRKYYLCPELECDITKIGVYDYAVENGYFRVEVVDSVNDYVELMREIFDFSLMRNYIQEGFKILADSMHGITGIYITKILVDELGADPDSIQNGTILEDFGGYHPDPNLTYAKDLVEAMKAGNHDMGVAFDGDGDRNMILGRDAFFVTPSDSLAVLAANLHLIPYFWRTGVKGYARSMPTAGAVDKVAEHYGKNVYVVPTGWKFFGNLMEADKISLCGEESFGTGSDHIREKDGIWTALAWISVLANTRLGIKHILHEHWSKFGRSFFTRYDYENCDTDKAQEMMDRLESLFKDDEFMSRSFDFNDKKNVITKAENFEYVDPVDKSLTSKQGLIIYFSDGSRIVFRLSGTGSHGATVRLYVDSYEDDDSKILVSAQDRLMPLVDIALEISQLEKFTGRDKPTVIT